MLEVFFITASSLILLIQAQDGISTPPMGWSTWNKYGCHINEQLIKDAADLIVSQGYHNAGYTYLNMDDCWQSNERTSDGHIIIDRENFPNGIRPISDYVHSKGLKFGIYSSAGRQTCAGRMASSGYELQDAQTYANMGVDYLKYDNCNYDEGVSAKTRYEIMAKAINTTGRQIFISVCNWGTENTWEWAYQYGHSFRTHDDIYNDWKSIVEILNVHATVVNNSGPGQWADPDMLEIGNDRLTVDESKTHFSIWSAMKSPLILGNSLSDMPSELYNFVTNKNVIAVNQDPLGLPAKRILHVAHDKDIWVGELVNQTMVVVIINYMDQHQTFNIDTHYCGYIGSDIRAFDLWENATIPMKDQR
ncbi:alpha-galactosidase [Halteromyces radiatus]|uniref:alpha-galactosidase n=1 Tax=Halteromyces radiatus TaxID=101107 RepID=UPI00221E8730|nr:alpha-galactosidase [Halteromyces radiatus]KAI8088982.1 alpha-galactosidase [Halteromyces radiatus]